MRRALSDSVLSALSELVAERMGLNFPKERWRDLERGAAAAARELGFSDAESCALRLLGEPPARERIEVLASHLTVGETYFYREKRSFEILDEQVLPELIRSRQDGERRLRIWSAGCCSGEEPYTIAMLIERLIPHETGWNVTILATDINPRFLRKAAAAAYGEWSFRGAPAWIRERYFTKRKDGRLELFPAVRDRVAFSYLNLAEDVYPSLLNNTNAMDVILCRNVLMYFTEERARQVVGKLYRSLVDGGWLIVSPTETSSTLFSPFVSVHFPGAVLYRKIAGAVSQTVLIAPPSTVFAPEALAFETPAPMTPIEPFVLETLRPDPWKEATQEPARVQAPEVSQPPEPAAPALLALNARNCANQGRLAEAIAWCEKAIASDKLNAANHYLLATIQQEHGEAENAAQSLMRALYLDPGFALAHFALGNLRLSQARRAEAERHFANALAVLGKRPHEEILPESDGLTAGRLAEIIESVLASQPRRAENAGRAPA